MVCTFKESSSVFRPIINKPFQKSFNAIFMKNISKKKLSKY